MGSKTPAGDRHIIIAGIVGNVMEWYDFSVYGYFAANTGRHFFPTQNAASSLIAAFGVFAAGFMMRPLGSLVFGHIGDKTGRKIGAHRIGRADGNPDLSDRSSSHISANWGDGLGVARADAAASRTFGRRRIYDLFDISCRTFSCWEARVFRKFRRGWRLQQRSPRIGPQRIGDDRARPRDDGQLGLARPVSHWGHGRYCRSLRSSTCDRREYATKQAAQNYFADTRGLPPNGAQFSASSGWALSARSASTCPLFM